jgi:hypothetical protein
MADAAAARKQAEGAHRHVEGLLSNDPKETVASTRYIESEEHNAEVEKYKQGLLNKKKNFQ